MKAIKLLAVCSLTLSLLAACSKDMDYRKACEKRDFAKAYNIVDKLQKEANEREEYYAQSSTGLFSSESEAARARTKWHHASDKAHEAEKYVVLQEAMALIEIGDDSSMMRLVGVAKEHNADNWLYDELIDIANRIGNSDLAERLDRIRNVE